MSPRDRVSHADVEAFCWNLKVRTVLMLKQYMDYSIRVIWCIARLCFSERLKEILRNFSIDCENLMV